jgi:putative NIF3 family GTP cyclohydrolase 1 type 2
MAALSSIVADLDALLATADTPDYGGAVNGLQLENGGEVTRVGAAVDFSSRTVAECVRLGCDLLVVHHGMFWGGVQPLRGRVYARLKALIAHDVAVYASHLPLDRHPEVGNNALLARALGLEPAGEFARYKTIGVGVRGESDVATSELLARAARFAAAHGGRVRSAGGAAAALPNHSAPGGAAPAGTKPNADAGGAAAGGGRRTRRWAVCTGAGASAETLREAADAGVDTLIVGEGPHHTFGEANDADDLVVIYAGHYATETLGVRALAERVSRRFGVPWAFIDAPTDS